MLAKFASLQWLTIQGLVVLSGLLIYFVNSRARRQRRHPQAAIAWVITLILMPYVALPLYLAFGNRKVGRFHATRPLLPRATTADETGPSEIQLLAQAMELPPAASYHGLNLHQDGAQALLALTSLIKEAQHSLDLCTFLIGRDALGAQVMELLAASAHRGVKVRLLVDGVGVWMGRHPGFGRLRAAGVTVQLFVSPLSSAEPGRTNLRNHRKMLIADQQRLWMGGRNLAAEYFVGDPRQRKKTHPWTDLTLDLHGELAAQAQARFNEDWAFAVNEKPPQARAARGNGRSDGAVGQLVASGPDQADDTVYTLLIAACFNAKRRILAVSPYFVPDATMLMALTLAARRGVEVLLVLPRKSNHPLADIARRSALRDMAAAGASIALLRGMVHAKAVVVDDGLALVGSANLDERSMFLNYELMLAFYQAEDIERFADWIKAQTAQASGYKPGSPGLLQDLLEGLVRGVAFQL